MQLPTFAITFVVPVWTIVLQGTAGAMGASQKSPRIFECFFEILVIKINKVHSSQPSSIIEFWLLVFSILVSLDSERLYQFWSIILAIPDLVWKAFELLSISPWDHIYPLGGFSFNWVNFLKPFQESDKHPVRIGDSNSHGHVSLAWHPDQCVGTWLHQWIFSTGFSVIFCFSRLSWDSPDSSWSLSLKTSAPFGLFSSWSGFSRSSVASSWQFCCTICYQEYEVTICCAIHHFSRVDSSRINIWCISFSKSSKSANQNISFPKSLRDQVIAMQDFW